MRDYVEVTYGNLPYADYPARLVEYIVNKYGIEHREPIEDDMPSLLDLGCGRGEYVKEFQKFVHADGLDLSPYADKYIGPYSKRYTYLHEIKHKYDIVFCKSVVEHLYYPDGFIAQAFEVLNPGGRIIVITPDWEACYRVFYNGYTHRTPFSKSSLAELLTLCGFDQVVSEHFTPTPLFWRKPWLLPIYRAAAWFAPKTKRPSLIYARKYSRMLLASGIRTR